MKFTTATVVLGAALGVAALPSHHAHANAHRSLEARDGPKFVYHAKPAPPAPKPTKATEEPKPKKESKPKTTVPKKEEPKPAPSQPKEKEPKKKQKPSSGSGTKKPFCNGVQYSKVQKRATLDDIMFAGNVGAPGNYACNLMMVDADIAQDYKYLTTFKNDSPKSQDCKCWLKIGADGGLTGFFKGGEALSFSIGAGEKKYMAADDNTQGACACGVGGVPLTKDGAFGSTWYEFDGGNAKNGGWSGADASCIVSAAAGINIPGMTVSGHGEKSIIYPGGTGKNAFLGGDEAKDGLGLNIPAGGFNIEVTI